MRNYLLLFTSFFLIGIVAEAESTNGTCVGVPPTLTDVSESLAVTSALTAVYSNSKCSSKQFPNPISISYASCCKPPYSFYAGPIYAMVTNLYGLDPQCVQVINESTSPYVYEQSRVGVTAIYWKDSAGNIYPCQTVQSAPTSNN